MKLLHGRAKWACVFTALLLLSACAQKPLPDWQLNSFDAAQRAADAYLSGVGRVATLEFAKARQEAARTGDATQIARVELLRCALRLAALDLAPCLEFEPLRADAGVAERAYADYLAGKVSAAQLALLPSAQSSVWQQGDNAAAQVAALRAVPDAMARLVAAGVLLQAGRASPAVIALAVDTASAQGWRRALLAWLGVQAQLAERAGQIQEAAAIRRRMTLASAP